MNRLDGLTVDLIATRIEELKTVFPEVFKDGKIDFNSLQNLLGESTEDFNKKYSFTWAGKADAEKLVQKRSTGTLIPCKKESVDFENTQNLYIEGDNLDVLKLLSGSYMNRIKTIYIDPPYNTGNDFVYNDGFADSIENYKKVIGETAKSNPETAGRYHTNWLNMMYPRLKLARILLRDDGVIFISIDDNEAHNLRKLCDEVFGEENFVEQIVWQKRTSPDARKKISAGHEYILIYAKNLNNFDDSFNILSLSEEDKEMYKNPDNDPRGPWVSSDFTAQGYRPNQKYKIVTPSGTEYSPPEGRCWKNIESVYLQQVAERRMWFGNDGKGVPRRKTYLSERSGKNIWTWWSNKEVGHTQEATQEVKKIFGVEAPIFDYPKPIRLIKRILQIATNPTDDHIILDFFSGSATTAHAVMQLNKEDNGNRRFILVQLPEPVDLESNAYKDGYENICEIGKERIRRVIMKLKDENKQQKISEEKTKIDLGFKVFRLDTSNLRKWNNTFTRDGEEIRNRVLDYYDNLLSGRTQLDMVYEIMIKCRRPLTSPIKEIEVNGVTAHIISHSEGGGKCHHTKILSACKIT